ncbi:hypothetical protein SAMN05421788_101652 [Filimonas lacunae]|uniref:Uncharacterized protein n=1 Tax=Filimonas lacunae TaxID=477680 RepID=A0A173MNJ9_9BACT|nr:hypothetical protein [Filimonas lacunae]BAV09212.1 hypothetical protein FLA_5260 [Filimonas lacunae]SIS69038.1 hypothetical protein SAMN05421788_101652 [Filimonas lacunae]
MKKVKIFAEGTYQQLQQSVNHWLGENKDISILSSNLEVKQKDSSEYLFYILYAGVDADEKGKLQTLAVVDQSAASVETNKVVEVITNPEVTIKN